jgi:hypothetical protein
MASYKISVFGYEIDATCHELNDEQAEILLKEQGDNQDLSHLGYDIETTLKDFYLFQDNAWGVNKPLINDSLCFALSGADGEVMKEFSLNDITNQVEIDTNAKQRKLLILPGKSKKIFLLYYEINKGELFECNFESAELPRLEDISYSTGKIQHPDGNLIFLDQLFLQSKELTCSYDNNEVSGKSSFMKVWRP